MPHSHNNCEEYYITEEKNIITLLKIDLLPKQKNLKRVFYDGVIWEAGRMQYTILSMGSTADYSNLKISFVYIDAKS
jgi:hypothetical protein